MITRNKLTRSLLAMALFGASSMTLAAPAVGTLEEVAQLPIRPGNVSVTQGGRVFATVHPLDIPSGLQLIEVTGKNSYRPWPSAEYQSTTENKGDERIDTPLGIVQDKINRLWIVDMGFNIGKTRVWAFDIASGKLAHKFTLPSDIAPKGAFVQDLAVDSERGWVYLADIAPPALIALNIKTGEARRFSATPLLQANPNAIMLVDGKPTLFGGKPASVGVNPLTLSKDGETLYFGSMNGLKWYSLPAALLREGASDTALSAAIKTVGDKPVSDGVATDDAGNHFITNLNENGVDQLDSAGRLAPLTRDARLDWPDSVQFGPDSWLYISVNQLHKSKAFTGGEDLGKPPYRIMRVWTGTAGNAR